MDDYVDRYIPVCRSLPSKQPPQDHFRAKIRIVLSKLCRKFGFEEIKALMPEHDKKLVVHMQTIAERELKAKKTRLGGGRVGGDNGVKGDGGGGGDGGITKALRTFDTIMEGKQVYVGLRIFLVRPNTAVGLA